MQRFKKHKSWQLDLITSIFRNIRTWVPATVRAADTFDRRFAFIAAVPVMYRAASPLKYLGVSCKHTYGCRLTFPRSQT